MSTGFKGLFIGLFLLSAPILPALAQTDPAPTQSNSPQFESWQFVNTQLPLDNPEDWTRWLLPDTFQSFTLARSGTRYQGPGVIRFSNGVLWDLGKHVNLGTLGEFVYLNKDGQTPLQEYRFVEELSFKGQWEKLLNWKNRSWIEFRIFPSKNTWRYRNMSRLNWKLNPTWTPFVSEEFFYDPNQGFNQNRFMVGVGYRFNPETRLDLGYLALSRKESQEQWTLDHALTLFLYFTPPRSIPSAQVATQ